MSNKITCNGIYTAANGTSSHKGVKNKIDAQINAFGSFGIKFNYVEFDQPFKEGTLMKLWRRIPFTSSYKTGIVLSAVKTKDCIYMRYFLGDNGFLHFLKKIKAINPSIYIVVEFFDWPYDFYHSSFKDRILLAKDKLIRNELKKYVNLSVNFAGATTTFGIPSISTFNGIEFNSIPVSAYSGESIEIKIIAVSTMQNYHGFDRLIKGLGIFYREKRNMSIKLYLIGKGPQKENYIKLADTYGISNRIVFTGELYGKELDNAFTNADIAVSSLGLHREGVVTSPLKFAESVARGLPVIIADGNTRIETKTDYIFNVPSNDDAIDIEWLIFSYESLSEKYGSKSDLHQYIRTDAEKHYSSMEAMRNIASNILLHKSDMPYNLNKKAGQKSL